MISAVSCQSGSHNGISRGMHAVLQPTGPHCCWPRTSCRKSSMHLNPAAAVQASRAPARVCRASGISSRMEPVAVDRNARQVDYFATDNRPVILFDGVCNLCNGGVNFVLDWDKAGAYRLAALQSKPGQQLLMRCGRQPDDISSIVLVEKDRCYIKSEAVLRIATKLGMPFSLLAGLAFLVPKIVRDPVYDTVANNRYLVFGRTASCRVTDDGFAQRFLGA